MCRAAMFVFLFALSSGPSFAQPKAKLGSALAVRSLSFSDDGKRLAAGVVDPGRTGLVFVWDVATRKLVSKFDQAGKLPNVVFAPDGRSLVLADGQMFLTIIDPAKGTKTGEMGPFPSEVSNVRRGSAGQWLALGVDNAIRVWDESDRKVARSFAVGSRVYGWAVSPKAEWLFVGADVKNYLWNAKTGEEVADVFKVQPGSVSLGVFMSDERLLTSTNMGIHRVLAVPSGKELLKFKNEAGPDIIAYSPAVELLVNRYNTDTRFGLTPFTLRTPTETEKARVDALLKEFDSDDYPTREQASADLVRLGPAIEPLLRKVAADGPTAEVRMRARVAREAILNKPKFRPEGHADEIRPIVFSPNGKIVASGGADGLVVLWDTSTGKELTRLSVAIE